MLDQTFGPARRRVHQHGRAPRCSSRIRADAGRRGHVPNPTPLDRIAVGHDGGPPSNRPLVAASEALRGPAAKEVAATLDEPDEAAVKGEIRDLFAALGT